MENKELIETLDFMMTSSGFDISSINIDKEYIEMSPNLVFKIGDIDILLGEKYMRKLRNYVNQWCLDLEQFLLSVILRAFKVAVGSPDEGSKDLPIHLGMKFHILENILIGIKIRRENKITELEGRSELIKIWY